MTKAVSQKSEIGRAVAMVAAAAVAGIWILSSVASGQDGSATKAVSKPAGPITMKVGPHLLLDDHLVAKSDGVSRKVVQPQRHLKEPILTGSIEHQNWQPFLTVLYYPDAPAKKRFRMWYNVDTVDDPADGMWFGASGYLESEDGVNWPGPVLRLTDIKSDGRVRFNASVIDDGPNRSERFKMLYFDAGKQVGPRVAFSDNGTSWTQYQDGKPIIATNNGDDIWTAGYDPNRKRYFLIGKDYKYFAWTNAEGKKVSATIRLYRTSFSDDFKNWSEPKGYVFTPDEKDSGITNWYGCGGFQVRGDLIIAFLRELRDDKTTQGAPQEAIDANNKGSASLGGNALGKDGGAGMGYTVLAWTRDGVTWQRDRYTDKFLDVDPKVGSWDHAMSWVGSPVAVGDEVYLYYAGYRWGHKYHHSVDRQIGLVKIKRDRYVARTAGEAGGTLTTPQVAIQGDKLLLNADAQKGEIRVQVCDASGKAIPGLTFADCQPVKGDALDVAVQWSKASLADVRGKTVVLEFSIKNASLFAVEVAQTKAAK